MGGACSWLGKRGMGTLWGVCVCNLTECCFAKQSDSQMENVMFALCPRYMTVRIMYKEKPMNGFIASWEKVMNLDRFELEVWVSRQLSV